MSQIYQIHKKAFIIFSGSNHRAIVSFCRVLRSYNLDIFIVARTESDLILKSKYKKDVIAIRSTNALELTDIERCINEVKSKTGVSEFIICPSSEYFNLFLLENLNYFTSQNCEIPLVNLPTYQCVSNKYSFSKLCKKHGIVIPEQNDDERKFGFPFVAKPFKNVNSEDKSLYPYLIYNNIDLEQFYKLENPSDFYFEEFIFGEPYYILLYISRAGKTHFFSQHNLIQQAGGKSIVLAETSKIHEEEIADKCIEILKGIGFFGLAMIEIIKREGDYVLIELNPRFWGPSQLMVDAGSNIFKAFINDFLETNICDLTKENISHDARYLWFNGLLATVLSDKKLKWHINRPMLSPLYILKHINHDVYLKHDTLGLFSYELVSTLLKT